MPVSASSIGSLTVLVRASYSMEDQTSFPSWAAALVTFSVCFCCMPNMQKALAHVIFFWPMLGCICVCVCI